MWDALTEGFGEPRTSSEPRSSQQLVPIQVPPQTGPWAESADDAVLDAVDTKPEREGNAHRLAEP